MAVDVKQFLYESMIQNPVIVDTVPDKNIRFYVLSEREDPNPPYIIIQTLDDYPSDYADNVFYSDRYTIQIDCYIENRPAISLGKEVRDALAKVNFGQIPGTVDEFDPETYIYRDGRRYAGKILR